MSRWGPPKRTGKDRVTDLVQFCTSARVHMVRAETPETLANRYGVKLELAKYHHALALQRRAGE